MNLRARGIVLSLLPLAIALVVAIPEAVTQFHASHAVEQATRSDFTSELARDVESAVLDVGSAARSASRGDPGAQNAYLQALFVLKADMIRLQTLAEPDSATQDAVARVSSSVFSYLKTTDAAMLDVRNGRRAVAQASLTSRTFGDLGRYLRRNADRFEERAHNDELVSLSALDRLWKSSLLLLVVAVAASAVTTLLLLRMLGSTVRTILALVRKSERYRRGLPLGAPLESRDEVGLLDLALHELVTAQEQREGQLKRYRLLADVTHDIILFVDRTDLTIVDANTAALAAYGYERDGLIGQPTAILHAADDPIDDKTIALSDTPAGLSYDGMHQRSDGTVFPVEVHARTADVEGRLTIVKTIRDISERRHAAEQISQALDQAVEGSRLKSEFVATMSHEIRTPMHGVIAMSELLCDTPLTPKQREYATTVKESAEALLAIIDDILDFSKLEANKIELETVAFDPAQVVASVVNLVRGTAYDKGLAVRVHTSPHLPHAVLGDPTRLRQVLINLIGNAVKFTPEGEVTISASIERDGARTLDLLFSVSDTGIGVAPSRRKYLFDAFVQGDGSTTRRFGGSGLGLSISRRLAELMGGGVWLADHEGPGSTFCFTIRVERTTEPIESTLLKAGALRVLVLDDDETACRTLIASLASWGMRAESVGDVDGASARLRDWAQRGAPFDVVLIDYVLPRSDGLAFAAELGCDPGYAGPARILMTAFDAVGRKEAALDAGCAAYLTKPIDPSDLFNALAEVERARSEQRAAPVAATAPARILLAEDSALIRRVARFQLEELAYEVDIVENGEQAVAAVETGAYELVLMDMRMPEMDGLAATRIIRAAERETGKHIIVVALTANVLDDDREACIEAGMDDYLTKPLQLEGLRSTLERWLPDRVRNG